MPHPLDSARHRLERADQNIRDLHAEIIEFLAPYPPLGFSVINKEVVFKDEDRQARFDVLREHAKQSAIPRFSVLAGEIIHHLRSAFDHVAWQLSCPEARLRFPNSIEFPVCAARPRACSWTPEETKHSRYCGKIQGILSVTALARIYGLQPYTGTDRRNHPLLLIHDMDRFDKHRELVVTTNIVQVDLSANVFERFRTVKDPASGGQHILSLMWPPKVDMGGEIRAEIAFAKLGGRENEAIIQSLQDLLRFAVNSVELFAEEFR